MDQIKESTVTDKSSSNTVMVEEEEETNVGASGTGAVVDMEVFGQLLEIVSFKKNHLFLISLFLFFFKLAIHLEFDINSPLIQLLKADCSLYYLYHPSLNTFLPFDLLHPTFYFISQRLLKKTFSHYQKNTEFLLPLFFKLLYNCP